MKKTLLALPFLLLLLAAGAPAQESTGKVFWRGTVDDKVQLVIRRDKLEHRNISGNPQPDGNFSFTAPVGPLRCLPMMISARPLSGEFSLL